MNIPKDIREHLARAKAHLQDDLIDKALESVSIALKNISSLPHISTAKTMDNQINATLQAIANHPLMQILLQHQKDSLLTYQRGKEGPLAIVLQEFSKMLQENPHQPNQELNNKRLQELLKKAETAYAKGEWGTGTSFLQRAAAEFNTDSNTLNYIGNILANAKQYIPAAKVFNMALQCAPKAIENYTLAINNFMLGEEYSQAEGIFKLALRQFGSHPRTYGRMATLYLLWKKYSEANEYAHMALEVDPTEKYALQVLKILQQKNASIHEEANLWYKRAGQ